MSGSARVDRDVASARWLQARLADLDGTVGSVVPAGLPAIARILHPATQQVATGEHDERGHALTEESPITWAAAAALVPERPGEPWTAWLARFGEDQLELPDGGSILAPAMGEIPLPLLTDLTGLLLDAHGEAEVRVAVWEGNGLDVDSSGFFGWSDEPVPWWRRKAEQRRLQEEHRARMAASIDPEVRAAMRDGAVLGLPRDGQGRGHVLLRGQLSAFADPRWIETAGLAWRADWPGMERTPNAMWPVEPYGDPAWFVATDLDLDVTFVGGDEALVARILADDRFEAARTEPGDRLVG